MLFVFLPRILRKEYTTNANIKTSAIAYIARIIWTLDTPSCASRTTVPSTTHKSRDVLSEIVSTYRISEAKRPVLIVE